MLTSKNWITFTLWIIAALFIVILNIADINPLIKSYYSDNLQNITVFISCYFCYNAAFCFPKENLMRTVWQLIASGLLFWGIGAIISTIYELVNQGESVPYPYYSDIGYLMMIVLFISGLLYLKLKAGISTPLWAYLPTFVTLVLSYYFAYSLEGFTGEGFEFFVSTCYVILDPLLFSLTVLVSASLYGAQLGRAWWYISVGIAFYFFGNQLYAFLDYQDAYQAGSNIDMLWVIGFAFIAIAAMSAFNQFTSLAEE